MQRKIGQRLRGARGATWLERSASLTAGATLNNNMREAKLEARVLAEAAFVDRVHAVALRGDVKSEVGSEAIAKQEHFPTRKLTRTVEENDASVVYTWRNPAGECGPFKWCERYILLQMSLSMLVLSLVRVLESLVFWCYGPFSFRMLIVSLTFRSPMLGMHELGGCEVIDTWLNLVFIWSLLGLCTWQLSQYLCGYTYLQLSGSTATPRPGTSRPGIASNHMEQRPAGGANAGGDPSAVGTDGGVLGGANVRVADEVVDKLADILPVMVDVDGQQFTDRAQVEASPVIVLRVSLLIELTERASPVTVPQVSIASDRAQVGASSTTEPNCAMSMIAPECVNVSVLVEFHAPGRSVSAVQLSQWPVGDEVVLQRIDSNHGASLESDSNVGDALISTDASGGGVLQHMTTQGSAALVSWWSKRPSRR